MLVQAREKEQLKRQLFEKNAQLAIARSLTPAARSQHSEENWPMHGTFESAAPTTDYKLDNREHRQ